MESKTYTSILNILVSITMFLIFMSTSFFTRQVPHKRKVMREYVSKVSKQNDLPTISPDQEDTNECLMSLSMGVCMIALAISLGFGWTFQDRVDFRHIILKTLILFAFLVVFESLFFFAFANRYRTHFPG